MNGRLQPPSPDPCLVPRGGSGAAALWNARTESNVPQPFAVTPERRGWKDEGVSGSGIIEVGSVY